MGSLCWTPWLSTARQLRRAAATRPTLLLAEEPSENKHKGCNWQHSDGKECECRADRKPSVLQMACTGQGLLATACCCTEPCSLIIFLPRAQRALISCCSQSRLCHGWAGTEGEASPTWIFLEVLALSDSGPGCHHHILGHWRLQGTLFGVAFLLWDL